jgi:serine protease Do
MKKILLIFSVILLIFLSGCIPGDSNTDINYYTDGELKELIADLIPDATVDTTYDLTSFQDAVTQVVEDTRDGVIGILTSSTYGSGSGSGVIYKAEGNVYYVVTNEHIMTYDDPSTLDVEEHYLADSTAIVYEKYGVLFEVKNEYIDIIGFDVTTDLAVLTFASNDEFSVIPLADSNEIAIGQFVFAVGNPLGFEYYGTITMGIISGLTRYVNQGDFDATLLQHDASISPGNSGGALLNINGELIGINNRKIIEEYVSDIGFAIPSNTVKRIITDLEDDGIVTRPFLGITSYAQYNMCGTDFGACVPGIIDGGAAEAAGLISGDTIIGFKNILFDDFLEIMNFDDLREAILNSQVGEEIQLRYIRDGITYDSLVTTLGTHPDD